MPNQLVDLDKDWKPTPPLRWRLEFAYVTHGDTDTDEAKKFWDLTHLRMWKARYLFAENAIKIPKDFIDGTGGDEEGKRNGFKTFLIFCNPALLMLYLPRMKAQQEADMFQGDVAGLTLKINAYVNSHGGNSQKILDDEKSARLKSGEILMPDVTIETDCDDLPMPVIEGRAHGVITMLEPVKDAFSEDYKYWTQMVQWCIDRDIDPAKRRGPDFYDSIAFNPHRINPRG